MNYSIKIDVWRTKDNIYGNPDETKTVGEYYSVEAAEVDVKDIELRLMSAGYRRIKLEIIEKEDARNYCHTCCNAVVEPELTSDNDLSYIGAGETEKGYGLYIRSGDGKPTVLVVSKSDESLGRNVDIGIYKMNYCPECGRRLIENANL